VEPGRPEPVEKDRRDRVGGAEHVRRRGIPAGDGSGDVDVDMESGRQQQRDDDGRTGRGVEHRLGSGRLDVDEGLGHGDVWQPVADGVHEASDRRLPGGRRRAMADGDQPGRLVQRHELAPTARA
jgi:hypothetical protein